MAKNSYLFPTLLISSLFYPKMLIYCPPWGGESCQNIFPWKITKTNHNEKVTQAVRWKQIKHFLAFVPTGMFYWVVNRHIEWMKIFPSSKLSWISFRWNIMIQIFRFWKTVYDGNPAIYNLISRTSKANKFIVSPTWIESREWIVENQRKTLGLKPFHEMLARRE